MLQPKLVEFSSLEDIFEKVWHSIYFDEIHQNKHYRYQLREDKKQAILEKIKDLFKSKKTLTRKDLTDYFKTLYYSAAGDYFLYTEIKPPALPKLELEPSTKGIELLGKERYQQIKQQIQLIFAENEPTQEQIEQLIELCADGIQKVFYDPPYYLKKPLSNLTKEELKWFRLKLGIPQKLMDNQWYKLPLPNEIPTHFLYKNRPKGQSAIEWLNDPTKFGQFLKSSGQIPEDILYQDQLRVLDRSGSAGLDNYCQVNNLKSRDFIQTKEQRMQKEVQRLSQNKGLTIQKEGAALDKIKLKT